MRCLDTSFLIDFVRGEGATVRKVREFTDEGERIAAPAVVVAELLVRAHYRGGRELSRTLELLEILEVLPFDSSVAEEAGRMGAESLRRGSPLLGVDLLIAASARFHRGILISRDAIFSGVPGLAIENY